MTGWPAGWASSFLARTLSRSTFFRRSSSLRGLVTYGGAAIAGMTYLRRIMGGERDFRDLFYRTPFLFHAIRRMIAQKYAALAGSCLFSMQTQSLYDASIDGLPHFLYTDHTHLANLRYPGADRSRLFKPEWIELERSIYHRVRMNLVMSGFIRESLLEDYGCDPSRIAVVGAAPNMTTPEGFPENGGYSNRVIVFVGVDWERKGGRSCRKRFARCWRKFLTRD